MSSPRGFRYGLQPVLATRRWHYEGLRRELGVLNARESRCAEALRELLAEQADDHAAWLGQLNIPQMPDTWLRQNAWFAALQSRTDEQQARLRELVQQRRVLIDRLQAARRALEGVERHCRQMEIEFQRESMSQEYRRVDDMWNGRATRRDAR